MNMLDEFDYRRGPLRNLDYRDASHRLAAFRSWLLATAETKTIWEKL